MKLLCANGCKPTASPTTSPITTESAKATASSQNVRRNAAGTPRVSNTAGNDMNTREGGLRNIGSTSQRAAISQRQNRQRDDREPRQPWSPQRAPQGHCGGRHQERLPRASSADTSVLRINAMRTTNTI